MKFMKYLFAAALAFAFLASAGVSHAQTVQYLASGSSALFLELGQGASALADTGCTWTHKSDPLVAARDTRPGIPGGATDENGNIWITWGPGAGTCAAPAAPFDVYAEMSLDSVLGDRCFFIVDNTGAGGCTQIITVTAGTAGLSPSLLGSGITDTAIPANVISALNGQRFFAAATDIRPEDAKFASVRMFTACGAALVRNPYIQTSYQTAGLGYQTGTTAIGTAVQSFTNPGVVFHVYDFNISGGDPITGKSLASAGRASYTVNTVGAQPVIVVVSPNSGGTGLAAANDINFSTLSEYYIGGYGRSSDLTLNSTANPVTVLVREPLSGTYNTFEFSVPNSNEFKTSQDVSNCSGTVAASNPMHIPTANGKVPGSFRVRAIGTGEVTAALQTASTDTMGYFFWSAGNAGAFTPTNGKYLTVNGVDPLLDNYFETRNSGNAPGTLPVGADLPQVKFTNLNNGDYAIWSALRIVSLSPEPAGVAAVISAAQTLNSTTSDFIPLSNLKIWKSHFNMFGLGITNNSNGMSVFTPGDLCSLPASAPEAGGDAGAMTITIKGNNDFCTDFNTAIGINDKNN